MAPTRPGLARDPATALAASLIAGMAWIAALSSLNVSAQVALPEWVRGRGLAMFVTAFFGTLSLGSAIWGHVAGMIGLSAAHFIAAAGALWPSRSPLAELAHSPAAGVPLLLLVAVSTALAYLALAEWPRLAGVLKQGQAAA